MSSIYFTEQPLPSSAIDEQMEDYRRSGTLNDHGSFRATEVVTTLSADGRGSQLGVCGNLLFDGPTGTGKSTFASGAANAFAKNTVSQQASATCTHIC
jgi:hypothetical protein